MYKHLLTLFQSLLLLREHSMEVKKLLSEIPQNLSNFLGLNLIFFSNLNGLLQPREITAILYSPVT